MSIKKITATKIISDRLARLISESGIKKAALAKRIGVTPGFITQLLTGESGASEQTIKSISREFQVAEEWLAFGVGEKEKKFEVTQIFEPEPKKTADHPLKLAICGYCDLMSEQQLLDEVNRLSKLFSDEQTPEKS